MGHYDSCYEAEYEKNRLRQEEERKTLRAEEKRRIEDRLYDLDLDEMKLVRQIVENIQSFSIVFNIINGKS